MAAAQAGQQAVDVAMLRYGLLLQGMSQPRVLQGYTPAVKANCTSIQQGAYTHFDCF